MYAITCSRAAEKQRVMEKAREEDYAEQKRIDKEVVRMSEHDRLVYTHAILYTPPGRLLEN